MHAGCWLTEVHRARWSSVWHSADSDSDSRQQWPGPRGTSGCAPVSGVWGRAVHLYSTCTVSVQCLYTRRYGHPTIDTSKHTKIAHSSAALLAALHSTILRHRWYWLWLVFSLSVTNLIHSLDYKILDWSSDFEIIFNVTSSSTIGTETFIQTINTWQSSHI